MTGRWRWIAIDRGGLLALAALIAYLAFASPHIVDGDNAEFSMLGAIGGRAHPSGYPLYVLWLRLWSWLPGTTAAHTAGLATAILGALAVGVLHAACRAWGARPAAATIEVNVAFAPTDRKANYSKAGSSRNCSPAQMYQPAVSPVGICRRPCMGSCGGAATYSTPARTAVPGHGNGW